MSLYPILWAVEHAPIVDAEERAILVALVTKGDFDGCNCYRSFATLARVARVDRRTAMRKVQAMTDRGLLREQTDPKPQSWYDLPADKRPVVREAMIPASFWSKVQLAEINEQRAARGRAPITGMNRPDLAEAPPKKTRADKGVPNPKRSRKKTKGKPGVSESPAPEQSGVSNSHLAECLEDTSRGVSESPNLPMGPSDKTIRSSSSAEVADITHEVTPPAPKKKTNKSPEDIVIERTGCTPEEAAAVVTYINQQGDGRGGRIRSLSWWVENRDIHTLRQDLAMVRGSQTAAGVSYDSDPSKYLRSINGGGYRPYKNPENQDVYDEPLLPPTQPAKNGVKGGVRGEVAPQATYDQLADMPEEDALARFMFGEQPA